MIAEKGIADGEGVQKDLQQRCAGINTRGGVTMAKIKVPFETAKEAGIFLDLEVPDKNLIGSFIPKEPLGLPDVVTATAYAVDHPLGSKPLSKLVRRGDKVVIITENQFRAAPAHHILPPILKAIRSAGAEVSIAIGNGKVPPLSPEEIAHKLGKEVVGSGISIECNDVSKPEKYAFLGTTTRGIPLFVLKSVAQADVKITISTTQATLWGYGGSGMIIPAVSGNETIEMNHIFSLPGDCRPGNNDCHIQQDKYEAARRVGIDMGVHVIVNNQFQVTYIGAGDFVEAHKAAIRAYDEVYRFNAAQFAGAPGGHRGYGLQRANGPSLFPYRMGRGELRPDLQRRRHDHPGHSLSGLRGLARFCPDGHDERVHASIAGEQRQSPEGLLCQGPGALGRLYLVEDLRSDDSKTGYGCHPEGKPEHESRGRPGSYRLTVQSVCGSFKKARTQRPSGLCAIRSVYRPRSVKGESNNLT